MSSSDRLWKGKNHEYNAETEGLVSTVYLCSLVYCRAAYCVTRTCFPTSHLTLVFHVAIEFRDGDLGTLFRDNCTLPCTDLRHWQS